MVTIETKNGGNISILLNGNTSLFLHATDSNGDTTPTQLTRRQVKILLATLNLMLKELVQ